MPTIEGPNREADVPTRSLVAFLASTFAVTWGVLGFHVVAPATAVVAVICLPCGGLPEAHGPSPKSVDPVVAEVLPLAQVSEAHRRVEAGEVSGKLALRVGEA